MSGDLRSVATLKAIKDTLDRHEVIAVHRAEQRTTYDKMNKKELATLALQNLVDAGLVPQEVESKK